MGIIIGIVLTVIGLVLHAVVPFIYWFFHDSLTWMQLFKTLWPLYVAGGFVQLLGMGFIKGSR